MISVIVPAYNAAESLSHCLRALRHQDLPPSEYEVIVVDDGSTDDTSAVAEAAGARVIRIEHSGPAAARNAGLQAARGEIILFTDADCEPVPHWARTLAEALKQPEVVGAKGTYLTRQREPIARFVQVEYEERYARMAGRDRIDHVDTYSAGYRRSVILANGGFDPSFREPAIEDQELSFRLAAKGYRLVFVPQAQVYHRHVASIPAYFRRKYRIGYWKALLLRWLPEKAVSDSHTPQALKAQIMLLELAGLGFIGAWIWPPLWRLVAVAALGFGLSAIPFLRHAWRRDRLVALIALPMLVVRAAALGMGLLVGSIHFAGYQGPQRPAIAGPQRLVKRLMDIVGALVGLAISLPLLPVLALAIRLDSPGPVFHTQVRVGENGRLFRLYKLRTLYEGAGGLDEAVVKRPLDPRVTRVGRWLRRWSLDELPQFVNVLRGEMSLVGPQPEEECLVRLYTDEQRRRLVVKPGMTGPVQVNGRGQLTPSERLALELDYIDHYSLWRDGALLWQTILAVVRGDSAP